MQFRDLKRQYEVLKDKIDAGINDVINSSCYISGPQVKELEVSLADYVGVRHCITCANGTDAISLALKAWGVGIGDAAYVPDFTFFSSGECPAAEGATCVFVDVEQYTYNMNPISLESAIKKTLKEGKLKPKVVIAVDLFGQPADYDEIKSICQKYDLLLLEDGAQGFGGAIGNKMSCSFGDIATTSFFPAKPLGCYGDGGAIFTDNDEWAALIRSYAVHGKNADDKYDNVRIGLNSRLDTIQAAILKVKLDAFKRYEIADVNIVAKWYSELLMDTDIITPVVKEGYLSSWAQYTIQLPSKYNRKKIQVEMRTKGIPTMVYYMKPMHMQGAFADIQGVITSCPTTESLCETVLSLPIHPYMKREEVINVVASLMDAMKK